MKGRPIVPVIPGTIVGRLTVKDRADGYEGRGAHYRCVCSCGNEVIVFGSNLRAAKTKSCGCLQKEARLRHGASSTPEYEAWKGMKRRCYNRKSIGYANWGGRGITVCDQWRNSFSTFLADVGLRPGPSYSLDRINVDGNYEPGNCRWATAEMQSRNTRARKSKTGVKGVHPMPNGKDFKANLSVNDRTIHIGVFASMGEAELARHEAESRYWGDDK